MSKKFSINRFIEFFIFVFIIPCSLSIIVYLGFTSTYSFDIFTYHEYFEQFTNGVYKYRILGTQLFQLFSENFDVFRLPVTQLSVFENCPNVYDSVFYSQMLYFNMFFFILFSLALFHFLKNKLKPMAFTGFMLSIQLLSALGMFVFVHYDIMSYFFLVLGAWVIVDYHGKGKIFLLGLTLLLATLTRETSILIISFYTTYYRKQIFDFKTSWRHRFELISLSLIFLASYFALRLFLGFEDAVFQNHSAFAISFFTKTHLMVFVLASSLVYLIGRFNPKESIYFLLFSLPYILPVLYTGLQLELRLWIPIHILLVLLLVSVRDKSIDSII